ncbi:hypothetical protein ACFQU2_19160 [Siccirubricoccus deserti]
MAAGDIGQQVRQQVGIALAVPEVVVRIDDRQRRLQHRLWPRGEPVRADGQVRAGCGRRHPGLLAAAHGAGRSLPGDGGGVDRTSTPEAAWSM